MSSLMMPKLLTRGKYRYPKHSLSILTNNCRFRKPYGVLDGELLMRVKEIDPTDGYNAVPDITNEEMEYAKQFAEFLANLST